MDDTMVKNKLKIIYAESLEREIPDSVFEPGNDLINKLFIDSLNALKMLIQIEQEFSIVIEDDAQAIELLDDMDKACHFIQKGAAEEYAES